MARVRVGVRKLGSEAGAAVPVEAQVHWVELDGIRLSSEDHMITSVEHHADHNVGRVSIHFACGSYETVAHDTPPAGDAGPGRQLDPGTAEEVSALLAELGQAAYNAYGDARDWKVVGGGPMPHWSDQAEELRHAWIAAAARVFEACR